ncbi:MAG: STN and carboxypeptidase regulatory-like domain-containing protein, partial [Chitinophagaceae bacterium]
MITFSSKHLLATLLFIFISGLAFTQNLLNKNISLEVSRQRLDNVLEILSNKGNFYFSYNGNIIKRDSLVSLSASNKTVKQVLDMLLPDNYEFRETGNYIIIRKAPISITLVTNKAITEDKFYVVSGYVLDDNTGLQVQNASIYEKSLLASTLTNAQGYFRLPLKQKKKTAALTVSKEFYEDTTVYIDPGYNQQITVTIVPVSTGTVTIISPEDYFAPEQLKVRVQTYSTITEYTYTKTDSIKVERTAMGKFLLSSQQRIQSLNLRKFFTSRPFQLSLTPGLGTHGKLSAQVVNNFSFNVFGGYNGGVNGLELGGLFNIDKKNVQYVQIAGLFNMVGGYVKGFQVAGINNTVLDTVHGVQVAGINNFVKGNFAGWQLGGIYNHVADSLKGLQLGGVANFVNNRVKGAQIAGVGNISFRETDGVQVAGIFNYAKKMKGVQIGLINISDTLDGFGIGLINIVLKGYHKLSFYSDEVVYLNGAFKTGSRKLYNILQAGFNPGDSQQVFTFGYGLGSELRLGKTFSINPELTAQHLYLGSWDYANILSKAHLNLNIKLGKYVSLFAGPVFNAYYSKQNITIPGYRSPVPPSDYRTYDLGT